LNQWNEEQTIAEYIFHELDQFSFDNAEMKNLYGVYRRHYEQGLNPSAKTLLYHENAAIRTLVVNVTMFPFELSRRWDEKLENIKVNDVDTSLQDVAMSLNYFKLRKIKRMFEQNQRDIEQTKDWNKLLQLMELHKQLKEEERKLPTNWERLL
jgi:DNA primase